MDEVVALVRGSATLRELYDENQRLRSDLSVLSDHAIEFVVLFKVY